MLIPPEPGRFSPFTTGSLWDMETAFIVQGVYTFAHIQSVTNSSEILSLIAPERIQLWAYAQLSRPPMISTILFLILATLSHPWVRVPYYLASIWSKVVLRSLETLDFHPLLINVYSIEDAFNSSCSDCPSLPDPQG